MCYQTQFIYDQIQKWIYYIIYHKFQPTPSMSSSLNSTDYSNRIDTSFIRICPVFNSVDAGVWVNFQNIYTIHDINLVFTK